MNEALKMADQLHHHPTQSNADKAAALLRSQHAEIEQLKSEIKTEQSLSFREQVANQAAEIEVLKQEGEGLRLEIQRQYASLRSYSTYVDWWKGKQAADTERLQERMDELVANDDKIIASQRDEIEWLNSESVHWKNEWSTESAITDALRAENQKLLDVVEIAADHHCLEDEECEVCLSCRARAALGKTK